MTTAVTEMLPSKMEITSKGKHPAIQTSKPCSTGDGAMLKMDDASDISVSLALFGQSPSVYSKTKGKRVILRVSYLTGLPVEFWNNLLVVSLLLSDLIEKDDKTGTSRLKNKWLLTILLPKILREVEEFFDEWGIPAPDFKRLRDAFDGGDDWKQYNAIVSFLRFYGSMESSSEKTHFDMRGELVELSHLLCKELHWQVFFRGELAAVLCAAFSKSPLLTNEINLYHLPYVESPAELAAKVEEAVEAQIKLLFGLEYTDEGSNE
jgi:hypothetical protein